MFEKVTNEVDLLQHLNFKLIKNVRSIKVTGFAENYT